MQGNVRILELWTGKELLLVERFQQRHDKRAILLLLDLVRIHGAEERLERAVGRGRPQFLEALARLLQSGFACREELL